MLSSVSPIEGQVHVDSQNKGPQSVCWHKPGDRVSLSPGAGSLIRRQIELDRRYSHLDKECLCHAESWIGDGGARDRISRDEGSSAGEEVTDRGEEDQTVDRLMEGLTEQEGTYNKTDTNQRQRGGSSLDDRELP